MTLAKLISCNEKLKQLKQFEGNIFTIYSPKKATVEKVDTLTINTELMLTLPEESKTFLTIKFTGQHIQNITGPVKQRLWITLLNESYFEKYTIDKGDIVGYLVFEPDNLKVQYEAKEKQPRPSSLSRTKRKYPSDYLPKNWQSKWKKYWEKTTTTTDGQISQSL